MPTVPTFPMGMPIALRPAHLAAVVAAATLAAPSPTPAADRPPNLVLVLADDLGFGDITPFGQDTLATPNLARMAAAGMRLTQFYAGSTVCAPSRSVLMTGKHAGHTTVRGNSTAPVILRPGQATVASLLKSTGYRTACIGKWGIGTPDNLTNPNDVGFDHFYGYVNMWHAHNFYPEFLIRNGQVEDLANVAAPQWREFQNPRHVHAGKGVAETRAQYAPDLLIADALQFIRDHRDQPFFLYFAMNIPHANNEGGRRRGMEVPSYGDFATTDWPDPEKGFAAMVQTIDQQVGQVLDLLAELDLAEHTLTLFTSDNGPHREGGHDPDFFDSNGPYRGIKRDLYEGGIRVPTIAHWPGTIAGNSENHHPWYFGDLMATAAELAGTTRPDGLDSDSFLATLKGDPPAKQWHRDSTLYWEFYEGGSAQAVRFGKWKAIRQPMFTGPVELYDLSGDEAENHDVAARRPKLVDHAKALFDKAHTPDPHWQVPPPRPTR